MECEPWTSKKYQSMTKKEIQELSDDEFGELAKLQSSFFPDMLKITDEKAIQKIFYLQYERKM